MDLKSKKNELREIHVSDLPVSARTCVYFSDIQLMIEKSRLKVFTLSTAFYDLSVSRNLFTKPEMTNLAPAGINT